MSGSCFEMEYKGEKFRRRKFITPFWFFVKDATDKISLTYQIYDETILSELESVYRQKKLERICNE